MSMKQYALPAVALSLCTTGCAESIQGQWLADHTQYPDGPRIDWPYEYEYDGATYVTDFQMEIFDDLGGEFIQIYDDDGTTYTYAYELTVSEGGEREYEIDVGDIDLVLACAHDKGQLDCIDVYSEAELLWVRER